MSKLHKVYKIRPIEIKDPALFQVDPMGPQQKADPDHRDVEHLELELEEAFRPSPEFKCLTVIVDKNLYKELKDQLEALI